MLARFWDNRRIPVHYSGGALAPYETHTLQDTEAIIAISLRRPPIQNIPDVRSQVSSGDLSISQLMPWYLQDVTSAGTLRPACSSGMALYRMLQVQGSLNTRARGTPRLPIHDHYDPTGCASVNLSSLPRLCCVLAVASTCTPASQGSLPNR